MYLTKLMLGVHCLLSRLFFFFYYGTLYSSSSIPYSLQRVHEPISLVASSSIHYYYFLWNQMMKVREAWGIYIKRYSIVNIVTCVQIQMHTRIYKYRYIKGSILCGCCCCCFFSFPSFNTHWIRWLVLVLLLLGYLTLIQMRKWFYV